MTEYFRLEGHEVVPCTDVLEWGKSFARADRVVARSTVGNGVNVSTVFLGINHRLFGDGPPLVFETMIFGGAEDGWQERCSTWDDAIEMHQRGITAAKGLPANI